MSDETKSPGQGPIGMGLVRFGLYAIVAAVVINLWVQGAGSDFQAWEGVPAPDFAVTTIDGKSIRLSEMKGRRVIINFWATWCPPCREEIPHLVTIAKAVGPDDLLVLGITNESPQVIEPFMQQMDMDYPVATNVDLPQPYVDVTGIPTSFVIDRSGIIQHVLTGYYSEAELEGFATKGDYTGDIKASPLAGPKDS